jgi:hypothetical protein
MTEHAAQQMKVIEPQLSVLRFELYVKDHHQQL